MRASTTSALHWIAGIALVAAGASATRLLTPAFSEQPRAILTLGGQFVSMTGLLVFARGIRLRIERPAPSPIRPAPAPLSPDQFPVLPCPTR